MTTNTLKLNENKSEFILFGMHQQLRKIQTKPIATGSILVAPVDYIRNLDFYGQMFEKSPSHQQNSLRNLRTDHKHEQSTPNSI